MFNHAQVICSLQVSMVYDAVLKTPAVFARWSTFLTRS